MATTVVVSICPSSEEETREVEKAFQLVKGVFADTEKTCSRFDPVSDLSILNNSPKHWKPVSPTCYLAIKEAHQAYLDTKGVFDPRILQDLVRLGYKQSWSTGVPSPTSSESNTSRADLGEWNPSFGGSFTVHIGALPIDLGGIGKGLALRWAKEAVHTLLSNFLIEAGGDCVSVGSGPNAEGWNIGIEDPIAPDEHRAVIKLANQAVCTSSVSVRSWWRSGKLNHHLISPKTGEPGGQGLTSVTVVGPDPAKAEVWSKTLFLKGVDQIREFSEFHQLAAAWISDNGDITINSHMRPYVIWEKSY